MHEILSLKKALFTCFESSNICETASCALNSESTRARGEKLGPVLLFPADSIKTNLFHQTASRQLVLINCSKQRFCQGLNFSHPILKHRLTE